MCRLKEVSFAKVAGLDADKAEQIEIFLGDDLNKTDVKRGLAAKNMGLIDEDKKNIVLVKEAVLKVDSAEKDFDDLIHGKLKRDELPKPDLGARGKSYPVDTGGESYKAIHSVANLSEAMVLMHDDTKLDGPQASFYNASIAKGLVAAEKLVDELRQGQKLSPEAQVTLFNAFSAAADNTRNEEVKSLAGDYLKNRKIEISNCNSGRNRNRQAEQATR